MVKAAERPAAWSKGGEREEGGGGNEAQREGQVGEGGGVSGRRQGGEGGEKYLKTSRHAPPLSMCDI